MPYGPPPETDPPRTRYTLGICQTGSLTAAATRDNAAAAAEPRFWFWFQFGIVWDRELGSEMERAQHDDDDIHIKRVVAASMQLPATTDGRTGAAGA